MQKAPGIACRPVHTSERRGTGALWDLGLWWERGWTEDESVELTMRLVDGTVVWRASLKSADRQRVSLAYSHSWKTSLSSLVNLSCLISSNNRDDITLQSPQPPTDTSISFMWARRARNALFRVLVAPSVLQG